MASPIGSGMLEDLYGDGQRAFQKFVETRRHRVNADMFDMIAELHGEWDTAKPRTMTTKYPNKVFDIVKCVWGLLTHTQRVNYHAANGDDDDAFDAFYAERTPWLKPKMVYDHNGQYLFKNASSKEEIVFGQLWLLLNDGEREHFDKLAHHAEQRAHEGAVPQDDERAAKRARVYQASQEAITTSEEGVTLFPELWAVIVNMAMDDNVDMIDILSFASVDRTFQAEVWRFLFLLDVRHPLLKYWGADSVPFRAMLAHIAQARLSPAQAYQSVMKRLANYLARSAFAAGFGKWSRMETTTFELKFSGGRLINFAELADYPNTRIYDNKWVKREKKAAFSADEWFGITETIREKAALLGHQLTLFRKRDNRSRDLFSALSEFIHSMLVHGFPMATVIMEAVIGRGPSFIGDDRNVFFSLELGMTTCIVLPFQELDEHGAIDENDLFGVPIEKQNRYEEDYRSYPPVDWFTPEESVFNQPTRRHLVQYS